MSRSIYWKITLPIILVIVVSLGVMGFFMVDSIRNIQMTQLRTNLTNEARLVADAVQPDLADPARNSQIDVLVKSIGSQVGARVTVIKADGTVIGDSWENPSAMENHGGRPEVRQALQYSVGESTRFSSTTRETMHYVAVPIKDGATILGTARVALPLTEINQSVNRTIALISWAIALAALLVILATFFITRMLTRPIRQATRAAIRISAGDLDQQVTVSSKDELGSLSHAFNRMSNNLKETLNTLSAEKNKLDTVLSTITDGVIMADSKGRIMLANPAAETLFNFKAAAVTGKPIIEATLNYEIDQPLKSCLSTQQRQNTFIDLKGGKFLRIIVAPFNTEQIAGALLLFQDLTELRSLQTMRREFVGNVSHELRTPLASIKAVVETLQDGALEDKAVAADFLEKVNAEVDSMTQMINELIELSRIETGKSSFDFQLADLNEFIRQTVERFQPQAERKQISLTSSLQPGLPLVKIDKERIQQALNNILHNAIKFTPADGRIEVKTFLKENTAVVEITDTGIGISAEDLPRIFERFFKADKSRSSQGSGLGLAIAKHIVQAHNGQIWVRSRESQGSTFGFSLPL
jgi:two-component system, OmpR family, phosphate regulon sensor histidine kinase PhoR